MEMRQKTLFNYFGRIGDFEPSHKTTPKTHLAIFTQPYLDLILEGKKTIESRFSMDRRAPYGKVSTGDIIIMKESGGLVKGEFTAGIVQFIELKKDGKGMKKCKSFSKKICSNKDKNFWNDRVEKKFATLIQVTNPKKYDPSRKCKEKPNKSMAGWFVL